MDRFLKAVEYIIQHEGGYNDIKEDKGGATQYGISLSFLKANKEDLNKDGIINWVDVKNLKKEDAVKLYYKYFWKELFDRLPERLGVKLFDTAVNMGHNRTYKILQQALNKLGSKILVDGVIGSKSISEINKYKEVEILKAFIEQQQKFYFSLVNADASQNKFLKGWINRANWLPA